MGAALVKIRARAGQQRDSSVHSCRSVHPESPADELDRTPTSESDILNSVVIDEAAVRAPVAAEIAASAAQNSGEANTTQAQKCASPSTAEQRQHTEPNESVPTQKAAYAAQKDVHKPRDEQRKNRTGSAAVSFSDTVKAYILTYFRRMRGGIEKPASIPSLMDILLGWLGAFSSILAIAALKKWATPGSHFDFLVASFGASAVLVFGAAEGKLSQPRNLIGGHVLSAGVGCVVRLILKDVIWISTAVGMAASLSVMQVTKTLHPPGGATALIAASAPNPLPRGAGFSLVLVVFVDACIMLAIGLIINNSQAKRRYPTYWF